MINILCVFLLFLTNYVFAVTLEQFVSNHLVRIEIKGGICTATLTGTNIITARHCLEEIPKDNLSSVPEISSLKIVNLKSSSTQKIKNIKYNPELQNDTATFSTTGKQLAPEIPILRYPTALQHGQKIIILSKSNFSEKYLKQNPEKFYKLNHVLKSTTQMQEYIEDLTHITSLNTNPSWRSTFAASSFQGLNILDPNSYLFSFIGASQFDLYSNPNYYPSEFSKENLKLRMEYSLDIGDSGSPVLLIDSNNNILGIIAVISQDIHFSEMPDLLQTLILSKVIP